MRTSKFGLAALLLLQQTLSQDIRLFGQTLATRPSLQTVRITHPIRIDGRLDEADWARAGLATNFTQRFPDPGRNATFQTEVRVLYDDQAMYVGARMFDPHPDSIVAPLARRDPGDVNSDWFDVIFDSYHDRRTGYRFGVNPVGTKIDVYHFNDGDDDNAWDARWEVATHIDSLGWTAEYRIPLSQLRFHAVQGEQVWGLNFYRAVARRDEWTFWSPYPPTAPGFVSNFGELRGIENLRPRAPLEIAPYVGSQIAADPNISHNPLIANTKGAANVGADFRIGLGSALSVTGTVNPDFGQVEVDPAQLNLTSVETFLPEKRPFFLEGAGIFEFGALPVFSSFGFSKFVHWRRIGRAPQLSPSALSSDVPAQTSIIGAAKLSGQIPGGWSIGIVDAVTGREDAIALNDAAQRIKVGVEPATNYFVARLKRDFDGGRTLFGVLGTTTNRSLDNMFSAVLRRNGKLFGIDGTHASKNRRWASGGYVIASQVDGSSSSILTTQKSSVRYYGRPDASYLTLDSSKTSLVGHDASFGVVYQGTPVFASLQVRETSPGFESNDLGYESRSDVRSLSTAIGATHDASSSFIRSGRASFYSTTGWNFGGDKFYQQIGLAASADLHNLWNIAARVAILPAVFDDRLTRGGPLVALSARWRASGNIASDARKHVIARFGYSTEEKPAGGVESVLTPSITLRPTTSLQISLAPTFDFVNDKAQYIRTVSDSNLSGSDPHRYVFATLEQKTLAINGRMDWTLTPALSAQLFLQPFVSSAQLGGYKELHAPKSFVFDVYGRDRGTSTTLSDGRVEIDPDGVTGKSPAFVLGSGSNETSFLSTALRANAVIRWEYRSGSEIYLVWQQTRDNQSETDDGELQRGFDRLLLVPARNVFYLKASYRIGR